MRWRLGGDQRLRQGRPSLVFSRGPARKDLQKGVPSLWWLWVGQPPKNKRPPRAACFEDKGVLGRGASRAPQRPQGLMSLLV